MPKNVPSYSGFHGVYNASVYWVPIILQSMTVWILAQHKTSIWYLASRLVLQQQLAATYAVSKYRVIILFDKYLLSLPFGPLMY
jgi:hypothetical protein